MKKNLRSYLKILMREGEENLTNPDKALEELDFTKVMLESMLVPHGFVIPEKDIEKYVIFNEKPYYYPPEEYYGKELLPTAFVDFMKQHRLLPIIIGNVRILQKWKEAIESWGFSLVFQYLLDSFNIILTPEDKDDNSQEV